MAVMASLFSKLEIEPRKTGLACPYGRETESALTINGVVALEIVKVPRFVYTV